MSETQATIGFGLACGLMLLLAIVDKPYREAWADWATLRDPGGLRLWTKTPIQNLTPFAFFGLWYLGCIVFFPVQEL